MTEFEKTTQNQVRRLPERASYEQETVYAILDEALICYVGFVVDGQPFVIPTNHARIGSTLYLHGAPASRMLKNIQQGVPVCVTAALVDGIVFARSVFHHSMNYRSATIFGVGHRVTDPQEKWAALEALSEHLAPGRWQDARQPNQKELDATLVVAVEIESGSAKARSGPPKDDESDLGMNVWAGVLPLALQALPPDADGDGQIDLPEYLKRYQRGKGE